MSDDQTIEPLGRPLPWSAVGLELIQNSVQKGWDDEIAFCVPAWKKVKP